MAVAKRRWGQHWLASDSLAEALVADAEVRDHDRVLEIGPGTGRLTRALLKAGARVVAVEVDAERCDELAERLAAQPLTLVRADILDGDAVIPWHDGPFRLMGNLPYNISGPILRWTSERVADLIDAHFMLQSEVADRIVATPGGRTYGALSVRVQWHFDATVLRTLPPGAFRPPPRVDSAFVRLVPIVQERPCETAHRAVELGFAQRRKQLRNSLASGAWSAEQVAKALREVDVDGAQRAETLDPDTWLRLGRALVRASR